MIDSIQNDFLRRALRCCLIISLLYIFLVSIGLLGVAFKGFGKEFAENLIRTTSNPFVALFIGIFATSIIQSSSTTTSIVVGFVAAGVLTVRNAIPIIMGANIGTTVTSVMVSLMHITRREEFKRAFSGAVMHDFFNIMTVAILLPLELTTHYLERAAGVLANIFQSAGGVKLTSPVKVITKPAVHLIENLFSNLGLLASKFGYILILLLSFVFLFFALFFIVKIMKVIIAKHTETMLDRVIGRNGYLAMLVGLIITAIVQSSSVTTSILIPMFGAGILTLESAFPITLGANLGTTVTAMLAALTGNISAITIAFAHFLFNITGIAIIYPLKWTRRIPLLLARKFGHIASRSRKIAVIYVLSAFFALPGILIFIWKLINKEG